MCSRQVPTGAQTIAAPSLRALQIENLTVPQPRLLKCYYWQALGIAELNRKLRSSSLGFVHTFALPPCMLSSRPIDYILWLRNSSASAVVLEAHRIQNCSCTKLKTRVGFNNYQDLYQCPHRRLLQLLQSRIVLEPGALVPVTFKSSYTLCGQHKLSYELISNDGCILYFHFLLDIQAFNLSSCFLTKALLPSDPKEWREFSQPIWLHNFFSTDMQLQFDASVLGEKLLNPNIIIPHDSVSPLIMLARTPSTSQKLQIKFTGPDGSTGEFSLNNSEADVLAAASNATNTKSADTLPLAAPILDLHCNESPYVVYPNRLDFELELQQKYTSLLAIHNYEQNPLKFCWQKYAIPHHFKISFEPQEFCLKPNKSKLCQITVTAEKMPLQFSNIPVVLEVHRKLDKSAAIAQSLLTEVESIDDPAWAESSYLNHLLLNVNIKVNFPTLPEHYEPTPPAEGGADVNIQVDDKSVTIFEKLFWDNLSKSQFYMRGDNNNQVNEELNYEEVMRSSNKTAFESVTLQTNKNEIMCILSKIFAEICCDIAENGCSAIEKSP